MILFQRLASISITRDVILPFATIERRVLTFGTPFYVGSSSVNTEDYKYGFPFVGVQSPYVGVTIVRARHDSVGLGSPIDSSYNLVVLEYQSRCQMKGQKKSKTIIKKVFLIGIQRETKGRMILELTSVSLASRT